MNRMARDPKEGVCHRPRVIVARDGIAVVDDSRVGAGHSTGIPVALVVMLLLVVAAGVGVVALSEATRCVPDKARAARYREIQALQDDLSTALRGVFARHRALAGR